MSARLAVSISPPFISRLGKRLHVGYLAMLRANASGENVHNLSDSKLQQMRLSLTRPYLPHVTRPNPEEPVFKLHSLSWTSDAVRAYQTKALGHLVPYPDANIYQEGGEEHLCAPPDDAPDWTLGERLAGEGKEEDGEDHEDDLPEED